MEIFDGTVLVEELEMAYKECEEYVGILQGKNIEEITEDDIEKAKKVLDNISDLEPRIVKLKKEVEKKITEIEKIGNQYPLVYRNDIISKEDDELLQLNREAIEKFENLQEKSKDKVHELMNIQYAYNSRKREQRATELVSEAAPAKAVWMTVECSDSNADFFCSGYKIGEWGPVSIKLMRLIQEIGWPEGVKSEMRAVPHYFDDSCWVTKWITFKEYGECDLEKKQKLREYEETIKEIANSENTEYDEPGQFEILGTTMKMTKRDLAIAGILSEEMEWKSEKEIEQEESTISTKNLAELDKSSDIKEGELMTIKKRGFKEWIKGLMDKLMDKGSK